MGRQRWRREPAMRRLHLSFWDLVPAAAAVGLLALWRLWASDLPGRVPVHWGPRGVNRWEAPGQVVGAGLALAGGIWLLMALLDHLPRWFGDARMQRYAGMLLPVRVLAPTGLIALFGFLLAQPRMGQQALGLGIGAMMLANLGGVVLMMLRVPEAVPVDSPGSGPHAGTGRPEDWKGGLFYAAPSDPRLLVPKLDGLGWTVNLGQPRGRWLFGLLVGLPLLLVGLLLAF